MKRKRKPIGYSIGSDYRTARRATPNAIEEVYELTPWQMRSKLGIAKRRSELAAAVARVAALEAEIVSRMSLCKHPVFNDVDGFLYFSRKCLVCEAVIDEI